MNFASLSNLRFMPMAKYAEVEQPVRDRLFFDAPPAPFRSQRTHAPPISHAKVTLVTSSAGGASGTGLAGGTGLTGGTGRWPRGLLYIGSHNLSQSAWGLGGSQPSNVELGVVLATSDESTVEAWTAMLPSCLPPAADLIRSCSERRYVPAQQPTWLRHKMEAAATDGERRQCVQELHTFLTANEATGLEAPAAASWAHSSSSLSVSPLAGGSRPARDAAPSAAAPLRLPAAGLAAGHAIEGRTAEVIDLSSDSDE